MTNRTRVAAVVAGLAAVLLGQPGVAGAAPDRASTTPVDAVQQQGRGGFPWEFPLPDNFLPEGIAIGRAPFAYFGSRADGSIYRVALATGRGEIISRGPGTPSVGLKIDHRGRLFVAGGTAGNGRVVDVRTGAILASYPFATAPTFVNDVIVTPTAAWFTDSQRPMLYGLPLGRRGALPTPDRVISLPLTGDFVQGMGNNANGIARTPDGKALLVVQSNTGFLFRVDTRTGVATRADLGGELLTNGDGLLVQGRTLFVVQNRLNLVTKFRLNAAGTRGRLQMRATDSRFDVPTTVAAFGNRLYLPNARFRTPPAPPETTFTAVAIPRP